MAYQRLRDFYKIKNKPVDVVAPAKVDIVRSVRIDNRPSYNRYRSAPARVDIVPSILGSDPFGNDIVLSGKQREKLLYLLGVSGAGKSTMLLNLILQDIQNDAGVCVLDPHGDLTRDIIACMPDSKHDDIILLDFSNETYAFGLNLYQCDDPTNKAAVQNTVERIMHVWDRLFHINRLTVQMVQFMRKCAQTIVPNSGYTMAEIPLLFDDIPFRNKLLLNVKDINVHRFWQNYDDDTKTDKMRDKSSILNKLDEFLLPTVLDIIGQPTSTINMRDIMDASPGKILLVKLDPKLDGVTSLVGSMIVALVRAAAFSRDDIDENERRDFFVYADEFDRFATLDFKSITDECRKFHVFPVVAHQTRDVLHREVPGLVRSTLQGNLVVFVGVTAPDAVEMAGNYDSTPPEPEMEENGRRPILVHSEQVVDELAKNGHKNRDIMAIFNKWIRPLVEEKVVTLVGSHIKEVPYTNQLNLINHFLVNAMTGKFAVESIEQKDILARIVINLRDKFSTIAFLDRSYLFDSVVMLYPSDEETNQAITDFILGYSEGSFSQEVSETFLKERVAYWLKYEYVTANRSVNYLEDIKTQKEIVYIERKKKRKEEYERKLALIVGLHKIIKDYYDNECGIRPRYEIYHGQPYPPGSASQVADAMRKTICYLEKYALLNASDEIVSLIDKLQEYLISWSDYVLQFDNTISNTVKAGEKVMIFTSLIVDCYKKEFEQQEVEISKQLYKEEVGSIEQNNDLVMIERTKRAKDKANQDVFGKDNIPHFVKDMFELAELLCVDDNAIKTEGSQYEMVYRPGQQLSSVEMAARTSNMLSAISNYKAYARIGGDIQHCWNCGVTPYTGDTVCQDCGEKLKNEYMVAIEPTNIDLSSEEVDAVIAEIVQQNVTDGYLRLRSDVEKEILERQQSSETEKQETAAVEKPRQNKPAVVAPGAGVLVPGASRRKVKKGE